jgi:alpha-1,3-glucan synthase
MMNQPWGFDGYSALDTTLLDWHYGTIEIWRNAITEIHNRGMYVIFDNTIATYVFPRIPPIHLLRL